MAAPARELGPLPPVKRKRERPPPLAYVVEVAPTTPDPKAAERVAAWLRERLR